MKVIIGLIGILMAISCFAKEMEICVVGAGIGYEDNQITYMTGIGPNGAEPHQIKPLNNQVRKTLIDAAKRMDPKTDFCMTGNFRNNIFEVSKVKTKKLK